VGWEIKYIDDVLLSFVKLFLKLNFLGVDSDTREKRVVERRFFGNWEAGWEINYRVLERSYCY